MFGYDMSVARQRVEGTTMDESRSTKDLRDRRAVDLFTPCPECLFCPSHLVRNKTMRGHSLINTLSGLALACSADGRHALWLQRAAQTDIVRED